MTVINLTPHEVRVIREGHDDLVFPPSGKVARLSMNELSTFDYEGIDIPVDLVEFGHLEDQPLKSQGTWYIVSLPTALAVKRTDFLVPYAEVRDESGRIVGCRSLARSI